jgi:hypothetical protein
MAASSTIRAGLMRVLLMVSACMLAACGKLRDTSTCRAAVAVVNPAVSEIEVLRNKRAKQDIAALRTIAQRYADLATSLKPLSADSKQLVGALDEYRSVLGATAAAVRSHADALEQGQGARATETRRELERLVRRERSAVTRLDVECRG